MCGSAYNPLCPRTSGFLLQAQGFVVTLVESYTAVCTNTQRGVVVHLQQPAGYISGAVHFFVSTCCFKLAENNDLSIIIIGKLLEYIACASCALDHVG